MLLSGNHELRPLLDNVRTLADLQQHFDSVIPPHLNQCSQVLALQFGTLSISVTNSTVAAKLRQLAPELVTLLQNRGCQISGIRVRVQVSFDRGRPDAMPRILGEAAKDELKKLSSGLGDSPLKRALEKMTGKK